MIDKTFERIWLALEREGFELLAIKDGVWAKEDICAVKNGKKYRVVCIEITNRVYPVILAGEIEEMIKHPKVHEKHFSWFNDFSLKLTCQGTTKYRWKKN